MDEPSLLNVLRRLGIEPKAHRRRKGWVDFVCPMAPWRHKGGRDRNPSAGATITPDGPSGWHCFTCKSHGLVSGLIEDLGRLRGADYSELLAGVRNGEAMAAFSQDYGDFETGHAVAAAVEPLIEEMFEGVWPDAWDEPRGRAYLERRGIGEETCRSLGLLFREDYPRDRGRPWVREDILFPVRNREGQLMGFTGRTTRQDVQPKVYDPDLPKRHLILGEHRWRDGMPKLLVEGLFGYAHLIEIGAEALCDVGALMGSVLTPEKADIVRLHDAPTYLLLDNDTAGEAGLFGTLREDGTREAEAGAVHQLVRHVPLYVPEWPLLAPPADEEDYGQEYDAEEEPAARKEDPDQLTLEEVRSILADTPMYVPPPEKKRVWQGKKTIAKASNTR